MRIQLVHPLVILSNTILLTSRFFSQTNAPFYWTHKMLKRTVKISLRLLLHVSVQLDHPQVGQFKCPVSQGIVAQEQDPLGDLPAVFFLQNVLQLHQQRWVILRVDSLALWKIINKEDAVLIPKNQGENFSTGFLHSEFFGVGWAAMPPLHWLLLCLQRFCPWSPIAPDRKSFGSCPKNSKSCSDDSHHWCFWTAFRHFGTHFA